MELKKVSEEVFYLSGDVVSLNQKQLVDLEAISAKAPRVRGRICTHADANDILHEMFIVHYKDTYVRPHSHTNKAESLHVISGEADVIFFDSEGKTLKVIELGDYSSGKNFYYRITPNITHCLIIKSKVFIFHESTLGPFAPTDTLFPAWAPNGSDQEENLKFMEQLREKKHHQG